MKKPPARVTIAADIGNRAGAVLLDIVAIGFASAWVNDAGFQPAILIPSLIFTYFALMPLTPLQGTLGKWICRIKLCDRSGRPLGWRSSLVRAGAMLSWCIQPAIFGQLALSSEWAGTAQSITWLLFPLPWALMGFMPHRESLFDLLAGSRVVRYSADPESISKAEAAQKPGVLNTLGAVLSCLAIGIAISIATGAERDMNRRWRVHYAITQTEELRQKIDAFQQREQRWPTAGELGVPQWVPYPDGGGYRLGNEGSVLITFSVLPELKGRSITFRPTRNTHGGKIQWQCSADATLKPSFLPPDCR